MCSDSSSDRCSRQVGLLSRLLHGHTHANTASRGHLYRHHLIHQCQRCKNTFESEDILDEHIEAITSCELNASEPVDGINSKIKMQLKCRKKAFPGQTEADKWKEMYKTIFPNEEPPSPCKHPLFSSLRHFFPCAILAWTESSFESETFKTLINIL